MATFYSNQGTRINNSSIGTHDPVPVDQLGGRLRVAWFSFKSPASEQTNDIIRLTKLPAGARVLMIYMNNEDMGTTYTMTIGDTADPDRLVETSTVLATANTGALVAMPAGPASGETPAETPANGHGYRYAAETWIDMKLTSVSTPTLNAAFRGALFYTVD